MPKKSFHLADILYVATGVYLRPAGYDGMSKIYDILKFMVGEKVFSIQIPRVREECRPYLLDELPWLKDIDASVVTQENWKEWLAEQIAKYGEFHEISPIPPDDHEHRDIEEEAAQLFDGPITPVNMEDLEDDPPSPYGNISWN